MMHHENSLKLCNLPIPIRMYVHQNRNTHHLPFPTSYWLLSVSAQRVKWYKPRSETCIVYHNKYFSWYRCSEGLPTCLSEISLIWVSWSCVYDSLRTVYYTKMYAKCGRVEALNAARVDKPCVENCAHPVYYAANSDKILPTFRDNLSVPKCR
jgi:NAD-dependent dihydropyrimidine dehydrogenase PreA subunit